MIGAVPPVTATVAVPLAPLQLALVLLPLADMLQGTGTVMLKVMLPVPTLGQALSTALIVTE